MPRYSLWLFSWTASTSISCSPVPMQQAQQSGIAKLRPWIATWKGPSSSLVGRDRGRRARRPGGGGRRRPRDLGPTELAACERLGDLPAALRARGDRDLAGRSWWSRAGPGDEDLAAHATATVRRLVLVGTLRALHGRPVPNSSSDPERSHPPLTYFAG